MRTRVVVLFAGVLIACGPEADGERLDDGGQPGWTEDAGNAATEDASDDAAESLADAAEPDSHVADAGMLADTGAPADAETLPDAELATSDGGGTEPDSSTSVVDSDSGLPIDPCAVTYYRDSDSDGFGDPTQGSCLPLVGYVANASDCYDANANARPGQPGRFSAHRGDGSFDFDCDGTIDDGVNHIATCPDFSNATCPPSPYRRAGNNCDYLAQVTPWDAFTEGWSRTTPLCGELGVFGILIGWDTSSNVFYCQEKEEDAPIQQKQRRACR